jgi:hypothetical protein
LQAVNNFRAVATTGPDTLRNSNATSIVKLRLACTTLPTLQVTDLEGKGTKTYSWSADIATIPSSSVEVVYNKQTPVNYTVNFIRQGTWTNLVVTGFVTVVNPSRKPMRLTRATWVANSNVTGQQPIEGVLNCPRDEAGLIMIPPWQEPVDNSTDVGNYIRCSLDAQLQGEFRSDVVVTVTTVDGEEQGAVGGMGPPVQPSTTLPPPPPAPAAAAAALTWLSGS